MTNAQYLWTENLNVLGIGAAVVRNCGILLWDSFVRFSQNDFDSMKNWMKKLVYESGQFACVA